ncbi:MAG: ABC transporter substrate-binding protein [Oscillospiraceae bacterium]|nr:ABC transporter substrate-binding protein [Oscillospiraceae bacterium]
MKKFIKPVIGAIIFSVLLSAFAGCSNKSGDTAKLPTVKVGWIQIDGVRPALVVAAQQLGYYKEEGINVEFINVDSVPSGIASVENGKLDVFTLSPMALSSIAKGSDAAIFAGVATEGSSLVVSKANSDLDWKNFKNWKGKKIGGDPTSPITYLLIQYIKEQNPEYTDEGYVEWVHFDDNNVLLEAISNGSVDGGFLTTERVWLAEERGLKEAFDVAEFLPEFLCCRQTTTLTYISEHRDLLKKLLRAQIRAEKDYKDSSDKLFEAVAQITGQTKEHVIRYIGSEKNYYSTGLTKYRNPVSVNPLYNKIIEYDKVSIKAGYYEENPAIDLKKHLDITIYEDALNELIKENPDDQTYKTMYDLFKTANSQYWE